MVFYFIKRHSGEVMSASGVFLLWSAGLWAFLAKQGTLDWDLDRSTAFGLWVAQNGIPTMLIMFVLSLVSGIVILTWGVVRIFKKASRQNPPNT